MFSWYVYNLIYLYCRSRPRKEGECELGPGGGMYRVGLGGVGWGGVDLLFENSVGLGALSIIGAI